ncbi:hypothetical protein P7L54_18470 [Acinetobacter bereziniae]|uniref:Lipoprotein n=1 Tax=Acinetobacter bereziniae LMG 1003 = CIP 70.12 TaxID=981324 RepID=N9E974_ACIBZ|nr:hypothetical protein [Acinetobacter bereziniae]ENV89405.1 hypothetical protein F938_04331 [Acinetobacter bereziniae LMG 1003 = CIP 70.12]MBJ8443225.1 hypothetical protein [Acinetobacter bereziniae]MBJ9906911.1 hypothetical protein [Acinetobacter bereziniae]MBJ9928413.1 hypothetical protein [Acinetobacter bereziniae]MBO3654453.1 hypothetical protein [Acinetobacter bereziniae]
MKYMVFLAVLLSIAGCKDKKVDSFQYEIVNNEIICSLKPKEVFESKEFARFDTFFKDLNGNPNDELSNSIYTQSLKNLSNKKSKYIFCFSKKDMRSDFLETYIQVELQRGKTFRQYEFRNYFCLKNNKLINFSDREKSIEMCQ